MSATSRSSLVAGASFLLVMSGARRFQPPGPALAPGQQPEHPLVAAGFRWRCALGASLAVMIVGCGGAEKHADQKAEPAAPPSAQVRESMAEPDPGDPNREAHFVAEEQPSTSLRFTESAAGDITGTLSDDEESMPLMARRSGAGFSGSVGPKGSVMPFTATEHGDRVVLEIVAAGGPQRLTFTRAATRAAPGTPGPTGQRHVVINDRRLSDEELARCEQQYSIRIPDADYWYDRTLGAWGARGSPTLGFIAPGLDLGGPLRPDASRGSTNVFVNGRELPIVDLAALQQITGPIPPGRYFITAQGLAGHEGGSAQWNLAQMAAASGGGTNTWQSRLTGASGFSDGTTGAVFLPNGGIVSTGN